MHDTAPSNSSPLRSTQADSSHVGPSNLVNAAQCAIALGVPKSSLYRMVRAGLPAFRIGQHGRGLRFDLMEVRQTLKSMAQRPVKP